MSRANPNRKYARPPPSLSIQPIEPSGCAHVHLHTQVPLRWYEAFSPQGVIQQPISSRACSPGLGILVSKALAAVMRGMG